MEYCDRGCLTNMIKRGVFAKPKTTPMRVNAPNSVFALAASLVPTRG